MTGETDDGRLRFELSDAKAWRGEADPLEEVHFWLEAAIMHWQRRIDQGFSSSQSPLRGSLQSVTSDIQVLGEKIEKIQKQLAAVLAENRGSARDVRLLTKEFPG